MEFKSNKGIYLQIADNLCNQILEGKLQAGDRVPSVRDLAIEIEVNRNTVMRTYSFLQQENIFENKRGVGFFVSNNAAVHIKRRTKKEFFENELPHFIEKINQLKLNRTDLEDLLNEINKNN